MLYFIDTEFIESGPTNPIDFISIGIASEDDRRYYAVSSEFDETKASDWVKENVISKLDISYEKRKPNALIKKEILEFVGKDKDPEFVADFASYDWVVFCQLFGTMMDLPEHFPMFCLDVQQFKKYLNYDGDLPENNENEHNALSDAQNCKDRWNFLKKSSFSKRSFNLKRIMKLALR